MDGANKGSDRTVAIRTHFTAHLRRSYSKDNTAASSSSNVVSENARAPGYRCEQVNFDSVRTFRRIVRLARSTWLVGLPEKWSPGLVLFRFGTLDRLFAWRSRAGSCA